MKNIFLIALIVLAGGLIADRYDVAKATVGNVVTIATSDTIDYADTNEHAFTLDGSAEYYDIEYNSDYTVEFQVTYRGNPNDVNLTVSVASSGIALTAANAVSQITADHWTSDAIDLNTGGGTGTEYYKVDVDVNGKYLYFKYVYSGDPGNDPKVAIFITRH